MSRRMWRALAAIFVGTLILALSPSWVAAQEATPGAAQHAAVEAFVRAQLAARRIPGASVAVVKDGTVVLARGYGLANVEHQVPATEHTMYQLASVTKQFTATAIMMLVEQGALTLATPVAKVLDGLPAAWGEVTVAQLLTHTSGIPSYTSAPGFSREVRRDFTPAELLAFVRDTPMDFAPGERFRYNNSGYVLLGLIIEKVSGQPWGTFLSERIFKPTGMATARVNEHAVVVPHRAQGYTWRDGTLRNGEYVSPTQPYAAGALLVSVLDLVKWDEALTRRSLLTPASLAAMYAPAPIAGGKTHPYGFGWDVSRYRTRPRHGHGGGIHGFSTYFARFPEDRVSVIVLANEGGGGAERIAHGIAEFYIPALRDNAPKPIADSDPTTTAFLKTVVLSIARGEADKAWFTPEQQAFFFPERVKEGVYRVGAFGPLRSFALMEESTSGKGRVRSYLASFEQLGVHCTFTLAPDGKIAGLTLRLD